MIVSRGLILTRFSNHVIKDLLLPNAKNKVQKQIVRHSGGGAYYYRKPPPGTPAQETYGNILGGIVWWWLVWHILTDYHEFLPVHFPDPAKWTDEELGIPPDDAD